MDKYRLTNMKKNLLSLGVLSTVCFMSGCGSDDVIPEITPVPERYSNIEDYYEFSIQDGEAVQYYNSDNVYLLYDKESYNVTEYIYASSDILFGLARHTEVYDLVTEEMIVYCDGLGTVYNEEYYNYLLDNNYQVCLNEVSSYVEDYVDKDYYTIDEIRALEPQIEEGLKTINAAKVKTKN